MDSINTQNSTGMMNGMPPMPKHEKKVGPIVGVLIIVLALIAGALYFFGSKLNTEAPVQTSQPVQQSVQPVTQNTAGDSSMTANVSAAPKPDDVNSLNADLNGQMKDVDYSF